MKKPDFKFGIVSSLLWLFSLVIKSVLDGKNASSIMYILVWIPIIMGFIIDYKYWWNRNQSKN